MQLALKRALALVVTTAFGALLAPGWAGAQGVRPGDEPLVVPGPAPAVPAPDPLGLPPLRDLDPSETSRLSAGFRVNVSRFEIHGSTVFSDAQLSAAVAPYTGRAITSEELLAARDAVTNLYVSNGYVSSGAIVPDQDVTDGVVRLEILEGALASVSVEGNRGFRDSYFVRRLMHAGRAPLNVDRIEAQLQLFQLDALISQVHARLEPGVRRGESRLILDVTEGERFNFTLGTANDRSPAAGSVGGIVGGEIANIVGQRDILSVRSELTAGLWEVDARYEIAVTRWDTRLGMHFRMTGSEIIEAPFDELDIDSSLLSLGLSLTHPLYRTRNDDVWLGLTFEYRQSESTLLGLPFCFQPETSDCSPTVAVLRLAGEWTHRTPHDVVAARMLLSGGLDVLGATDAPDDLPDGVFVSWLAQLQWVHVLPDSLWDSWLVFRGSAQLANAPLLSIERFSVGGRNTVRGYRESQLVRDNGVVGSAELRVPVWRDPLGRHLVQLVPFVDVGHAWNDGLDPPTNTIASVGLGLRVEPVERVRGEFFWGYRIEDVPNPKQVAQDYGISFQVVVDVF